jgi:hypothetical protein
MKVSVTPALAGADRADPAALRLVEGQVARDRDGDGRDDDQGA